VNFRNFSQAQIFPNPRLNIIYGQNGAGKSSLLEAVHLLGYGRSFRTTKANSMLKHDEQELVVFAEVEDQVEEVIKKIGCSRHRKNGYTFKIDGESGFKLNQLVKQVPVQLFTPQSSDLILGSPGDRRKYLDWLLFHVEQSFSSTSSNFNKVLSHRNAILKKLKTKDLSTSVLDLNYWDDQFCALGEALNEVRKQYTKAINVETQSICEQFLPEFKVEISYNAGWDLSRSLKQELENKKDRDIQYGFTNNGPHKGDLIVKADGNLASEVLSRGQLRLLVSMMQLAHMRMFSKARSQSLIYLIDDIAAELDISARKRFIDLLLSTDTQVFVTAIEKNQFDFMNDYNDKKVFHVEHDQVNEE
jgi:DNA replication and repair protein RecF